MKRTLCIICLLIAGCSTNTNTAFRPNLNEFRQMENAIGCIRAYNYNRSMQIPYKIGPVPSTQQAWQHWNMLNLKHRK